MSSSRSIAAARSRRAGESQPPVSGGRPVTSIASHSAFVQQQMPPPPPNNVRVAKAPMQQQQQMSQQGASPFSKLSISDAIGLVTLRLGRVEQFIIDFENGEIEGHHPNSGGGSSIPENSKIVDNSVLTTIVNRLDALEKKEGSGNVNASSIASLEKEMKEAKDLLSHLLFKYELFTKETNEKFGDFEGAISEIEKNMESQQFVDIKEPVAVVDESIPTPTPTLTLTPAPALEINALDLKSLIKQEFSGTDSN